MKEVLHILLKVTSDLCYCIYLIQYNNFFYSVDHKINTQFEVLAILTLQFKPPTISAEQSVFQ